MNAITRRIPFGAAVLMFAALILATAAAGCTSAALNYMDLESEYHETSAFMGSPAGLRRLKTFEDREQARELKAQARADLDAADAALDSNDIPAAKPLLRSAADGLAKLRRLLGLTETR